MPAYPVPSALGLEDDSSAVQMAMDGTLCLAKPSAFRSLFIHLSSFFSFKKLWTPDLVQL